MERMEVEIREIVDEAPDIKSLLLAAPSGARLTGASPGAHIDVVIAPGIVRQYSLWNGPEDDGVFRIAVKREAQSRGGSQRVHDEFAPGRVIEISAARNHFPLDFDAPHSVLVAGGIGITPILSMARHLLARGHSFELHYFTRSVGHTAFHERIRTGGLRNFTRFHHALEGAALHDRLDGMLRGRREGAHLYLCGPAPFMTLVRETAQAAWPDDAVHFEYFGAAPQASSNLQDADAAFTVELARSGRTVSVQPGCSTLDALRAAGVEIESSCEQGVCGTCLVHVLDGVPDHRDLYLTDEERVANQSMLPCVSRACSATITLDL
ncbi:vanB family oxidoreductase/oxygenase [Burkholderia sp. YI23]|nr:vanB family oxidoreductase/oxygenase [Burkholderia sp. YI23]